MLRGLVSVLEEPAGDRLLPDAGEERTGAVAQLLQELIQHRVLHQEGLSHTAVLFTVQGDRILVYTDPRERPRVSSLAGCSVRL